MAYAKRYAGGFVDKPTLTTPIDSQFLNAVETALLELLTADGSVDGQVMQWISASTRFGPALLLNKNVDPAAAIDKSKLNLAGQLTDADISGAAAIARSKLNFGSGLVNADIAAAAAIAYSKLVLTGSIVNADVAAAAAIAGSKLNLIPATTLNASPTNGEVGLLTDSTTVPTYVWAFVWNAAAAKWVFVGGSPAISQIDTSENVASATYVDVTTVGPSFTAPRTGTYILSYGFEARVTTAITNAIYAAPKVGAAAAADADAAKVENNSAVESITVARTKKFTTVTAADLIKLQYREGTAGAIAVSDRWMTVLPVTVT